MLNTNIPCEFLMGEWWNTHNIELNQKLEEDIEVTGSTLNV